MPRQEIFEILFGYSLRDQGRFPFNKKIRKLRKQEQMLRKFPEKRTIQPKIPSILGGKSNGREIPDEKFRYTSQGCPPFQESRKMLFHWYCHWKFPGIQ